ncbi:serine protease, type IV, possibly signal peptide processing [Sulfurimonas gotlandica GD1]|jgi:protease-4|uniref:Serine protease, type IV, possibly signal peptide processing n=1 Tax=Sulfurimonas gotlandica (strain DSM 19862 / JCM 16533 / GD1) TaxID=929558 RepID=B6BN16_SULGG|nr:signal peptide peptidase SppA [Sulfurimonas gotlandica]EDZ61586.1 signal peptide peptidase SppA, 36K type [Sulfurimonas gotlandica GD1]EHP30708.1 serine protease, type IV, possibly signal peptide processing [Sulfurimonas gotlandica GD1]
MQFLKRLFSPITTTLGFIQNHFKAMVFVLILVLIFAPESEQDLTQNNLQQINLVGPIIEVSEILEQIEKAGANNNVKGVLLVVDSPGGAVAPSIEIAYAIKRLRTKKPVIAYAKGTIASGSYYASIWANEIIANPGSMVGSIGVIMQGADMSELMDKIGISTQSVKAGKYKQVGTPDRKWEPYEINELNKVIQGTYDMFTQDVAKARGLDIKKRDQFANAHIFTAQQAKDVGLVDSLGVSHNAKMKLILLSGVDDPIWNKEDKFDKIMKKLTASTALTLHTYFPALILK